VKKIIIIKIPHFARHAQSVKNTDTVEQKEYDSGKKVSGIKYPLL
jgi:hypothetical protein